MITGVNHVTISVRRIGRAFDFYAEVLGCAPVARWSNGAYLRAGDVWIALVESAETSPAAMEDYSHIALSCEASDFAALRSRLVEVGAIEWSENRSEGASFYFLDPDGHKLEIHVGELQSRLVAMKADPWDDIEYFEND